MLKRYLKKVKIPISMCVRFFWFDSPSKPYTIQNPFFGIPRSQVRRVSLANKKFSKHKYYTTFEDGYQDYLNPEFQKNPAMDIFSRPIQRFSLIKLHATESQKSLNEVCEGVAGVKNHTKESCRPQAYFASEMSLLFCFDQMDQ